MDDVHAESVAVPEYVYPLLDGLCCRGCAAYWEPGNDDDLTSEEWHIEGCAHYFDGGQADEA